MWRIPFMRNSTSAHCGWSVQATKSSKLTGCEVEEEGVGTSRQGSAHNQKRKLTGRKHKAAGSQGVRYRKKGRLSFWCWWMYSTALPVSTSVGWRGEGQANGVVVGGGGNLLQRSLPARRQHAEADIVDASTTRIGRRGGGVWPQLRAVNGHGLMRLRLPPAHRHAHLRLRTCAVIRLVSAVAPQHAL